MNQNWKTFGMNSAQQSEADMASEEYRKRMLTGAVIEYLDEELVEEFLSDLLQVLVTESEQYVKKATAFSSCAQLIEKGLGVLAEEQEKEMAEK
jgi:hypothetical protein